MQNKLAKATEEVKHKAKVLKISTEYALKTAYLDFKHLYNGIKKDLGYEHKPFSWLDRDVNQGIASLQYMKSILEEHQRYEEALINFDHPRHDEV